MIVDLRDNFTKNQWKDYHAVELRCGAYSVQVHSAVTLLLLFSRLIKVYKST